MGLIWTPKLIKPPLGTPLNKSDPINRGLVGSWLMNEKAGSTVLDSSDNRNHGTLTNSPVWSAGKYGPSILFNPTNTQFINIGDKKSLDGMLQLSFGATFRLNAEVANGTYAIIGKFDGTYDSTSTYQLDVQISSTRFWRALLWAYKTDNSAYYLISDYVNNAAFKGTWHTIVGVCNGVTGEIFVDGKSIKSSARVGEIQTSATNFCIGSRSNGGNYFDGDISDGFVYRRALSSSEIQRLYRNPFCGYGRPMIELFSVSAGGGGTNYTETINDGIGITDALGKVASVLRTLTESLGITDSVTKTSIAIRTISEALGITDEIVKSEAKVISDSLGITDMADKTSVSVRTLSETLGITDSVVRTALVLRAISETIGMTDIANQLSEITRVLSDTIGITDDITKTVSVLRTISDLLGITDSITRLWVIIRTISDDIGITDETIIEGIGAVVKVINDTIGISDNASKVVTALRTLSEQVGMSDAIARVFIISRIITDSERITDGIALDRVMTISNALGISDSVTKLINFVRTNNDDIGILDSIVKVTVALRTINDVVGISDDVTESLGGLVKAAWAFMMLKKHK